MKKRKIANIISTYYFVYAIIALSISGPIFTIITNYLYRLNVKIILQDTRERFYKEMAPNLTLEDVEVWNKTHWNLKILKDTTTQETSIVMKTYQTKGHHEDLKLELYSPLVIQGKRYTFWTVQDIVEPRSFYFNTLLMFGGLAIFLFLGLYFITRKLSRYIGKSFDDVLSQIKNFNLKKETLPHFPKEGISELVELCAMLYDTMINNIKIHDAQQEFIENAAHEIQTPLAIFQIKVDILSQDPLVIRQQWEIVNDLNKNIARMTRLNKNLLLLSKIDHNVYGNTEKISINKVIDDQMDFFVEQLLKKHLSLELAIDDIIEVEGNYGLIEILIRNLFMNAVRHNIEKGSIFVSTKSPHSFTVSNSGTEPLLEDKLFNRFYKKNTADDLGTGLGLSIIHKIVEKNNWTINYYFENNQHHFQIIMTTM